MALIAVVGLLGVACQDSPSQTAVDCVEDEAGANTERVPIYKVVSLVKQGTGGEAAIEQGSFQPAEIAAEFRPPTAVIGLEVIADGVAVSDLQPNQVLVGGSFGVTEPGLPPLTTAPPRC